MGKCRKPSRFNFGMGTGGKNCARTLEDQGRTTIKGQSSASKRRTYWKKIQITVQESANFIITPSMLLIDEETTQKLMKDIKKLDLLMPKIPTKVLYKLQVSVADPGSFH
jgi:hypothetical protein